jgi:dynein heavy chain 1
MLECIDEWLDSLGTGRETIDPDKIPWDALRTLAADSIFGGKVDNEYDLKILQSLVDYFFKKETFDMAYPLFDSMEAVREEDQLVIPDVKGYKEFQAWVRNMPSVESPAWAGLPLNVEKLNRIRQADSLIKNIKQIQNADEEEDAAAGDDDKAAWLTALQRRIAEYMDFLPIKLDKMKRVGDLVKNPLFRFLEREVSELSSMLKNIRADLEMVAELCIGERKSTV